MRHRHETRGKAEVSNQAVTKESEGRRESRQTDGLRLPPTGKGFHIAGITDPGKGVEQEVGDYHAGGRGEQGRGEAFQPISQGASTTDQKEHEEGVCHEKQDAGSGIIDPG